MRPIPTIEDPERYIDSAFVDSVFIELKSCDLWDVKMLYPILHMDHAEENCFVRKEMYERLVKAAGNLPDGYRFRIWDAWRPFALQHELFEKYSVDIIRDFHLEELPEAKGELRSANLSRTRYRIQRCLPPIPPEEPLT